MYMQQVNKIKRFTGDTLTWNINGFPAGESFENSTENCPFHPKFNSCFSSCPVILLVSTTCFGALHRIA